MNNMPESLHDQKLEQAAKEFADNGYRVTLEPSSAELPFDLGNYKPNLIAIKDGEGVILEVKGNRHTRLSIDRYQEISETIASHQGWKFILVTLNDVNERIVPSEKKDLPSWNDLFSRFEKIDGLFRGGLLEPILLYLWSTIEAALRKRAITQKIPIERFPAINLVNNMYSSGEISIFEFELLKSVFEKRNRAAHGLVVSLEPREIETAINISREFVGRWREDDLEG